MNIDVLDAAPSTVVTDDSPSMRPKSFAGDFSWTLAGNVFYSACMVGWMVLISKLGSLDSRGRYVFATVTTTPIIMFAALGLRQMLATDVRHEHKFSRYLALRLFCAASALVIIGCIAWTLPWAAAVIVLVVGAAKALESVSDIIFGRLQQFEKFDWIARSQFVKGAATLTCLAIGLAITRDAFGAALGLVAGFMLTLLFWDAPLARRIARGEDHDIAAKRVNATKGAAAFSPDTEFQIRQFLWHAIPLALATTLVTVNLNMPIYFLRLFYGQAAEPLIGVYGTLNQLPAVGSVLMNAIGIAASTRLAALYGEGKFGEFYRFVRKLTLFCAAVGAAGIVVALIAGRLVVTILYKQEDAAHISVLVWLVVSGAFINTSGILGYAVTATRRFHRFLIPYLAVTIAGAIACAILVSRHDIALGAGSDAALNGAAWSSIVIGIALCLAPVFILIGLHITEHGRPSRTTG